MHSRNHAATLAGGQAHAHKQADRHTHTHARTRTASKRGTKHRSTQRPRILLTPSRARDGSGEQSISCGGKNAIQILLHNYARWNRSTVSPRFDEHQRPRYNTRARTRFNARIRLLTARQIRQDPSWRVQARVRTVK